MPNIILNGKSLKVDDGATAADLVSRQALKKAAVWVNGTQLLAAEYVSYELREGDQVKLLRVLGGG